MIETHSSLIYFHQLETDHNFLFLSPGQVLTNLNAAGSLFSISE